MFYIDLEESLTLKKKKLCIIHSFFQISTIASLYAINAVKMHLKKLKIFKKEPYIFLFNDKVSTYESHLDRCGITTLHIRRIKTIANQVFKSVHDINPIFMKEMFNTKGIFF